MSTIAPHRAAMSLMAESEAHGQEALEALDALMHELAHIGRRMNEVRRSSRLSVEKAWRAQNIASGLDEFHGFTIPGQAELYEVAS